MYRKLFLAFILFFSITLFVSSAYAEEVSPCDTECDAYDLIECMREIIDDEINDRTIKSRLEGMLKRTERYVPKALDDHTRSLNYAIRYIEKFKMYDNRYMRTNDIDEETGDELLARADELIDTLRGECEEEGCPEELRVFTTSLPYDGDLEGLAGADAICQSHADEAGLSGTFKAWISDTRSGPADRWSIDPSLPYVRTDGATVADDWFDLTDGSLDIPIERDEDGDPIIPFEEGRPFVWTDTDTAGTPESGSVFNCEDWTTSGESSGIFGDFTKLDPAWTFWDGTGCGELLHLYCFEQAPDECLEEITCNDLPADDPAVCSSEGTCVSQDTCDCFDNDRYTGADCDIPVCNFIPATDPSVCSGNGTCELDSICSCDEGYEGFDCETEPEATCGGIPQSDPSVCSGEGTCVSQDTCDCFDNNRYTGADCDIPVCFTIPATDPGVCSGNGTCTAYDTCDCDDDGYYLACDSWTCWGFDKNDIRVCSGGGECSSPGICECDDEHQGDYCEDPISH